MGGTERQARGAARLIRAWWSSGARCIGDSAWRLCSPPARPTVTPITPVAMLPRLLGAMVLPLLLCAAALWRAAWRVIERG